MAITSFNGKYRFLSNFWCVPVRYGGHVFPSVENAYQAAKCASKLEMQEFTDCSAGEAKKLGQKVRIRQDWEVVKIGIMLELLRQKFQWRLLKEKLLATGDELLVEGNTWGDQFWGIYNRKGMNMLGKLLMVVRREAKYKMQYIQHDKVANMSTKDWEKLIQRLKIKG